MYIKGREQVFSKVCHSYRSWWWYPTLTGQHSPSASGCTQSFHYEWFAAAPLAGRCECRYHCMVQCHYHFHSLSCRHQGVPPGTPRVVRIDVGRRRGDVVDGVGHRRGGVVVAGVVVVVDVVVAVSQMLWSEVFESAAGFVVVVVVSHVSEW